MSGDWHNEDWHDEVLDDEGNYFRNDAAHEIPDVNLVRGSAEKRLDLTHGFVRHIQQLQVGRQKYETDNPSKEIQQRYIEPVERPQEWRKQAADQLLSPTEEQTEAQRDCLENGRRYVPPHLRSMSSPIVTEREAQCKGVPPGFEDAITNSSASGQRDLHAAFDSMHHQSMADLSSEIIQSTSTRVADSEPQDVVVHAAPSSTMATTQADMPSVDVSTPAVVPHQELSEADAQDSAVGRQGKFRKFRPGHATYAPPPMLPDMNGVEIPVDTTALPQLVALSQPAHAGHVDSDLPPGFAPSPQTWPQQANVVAQHPVAPQSFEDLPPGFAHRTQKALAGQQAGPPQPQLFPDTAQAEFQSAAANQLHSQSAMHQQQAALTMPPAARSTDDNLPPGFLGASKASNSAGLRLQPQKAAAASATRAKSPAIATANRGKLTVKALTTVHPGLLGKPQQAQQPTQEQQDGLAGCHEDADLPPGFSASAKSLKPSDRAPSQDGSFSGAAKTAKPVTPSATPSLASGDLPPGFSAPGKPDKTAAAPLRKASKPSSSSKPNIVAAAPREAAQGPGSSTKATAVAVSGQPRVAVLTVPRKAPGSQAVALQTSSDTSDSLPASTPASNRRQSTPKALSGNANTSVVPGDQPTSGTKQGRKPRQITAASAAVSAAGQAADNDLPPGFTRAKPQQKTTATAVLTAPLAAVTAAASAAPARVAGVVDQAKTSLRRHLGLQQTAAPNSATGSPYTAATPASAVTAPSRFTPPAVAAAAEDDRPPGFFAAAATAVTSAFAAGDMGRLSWDPLRDPTSQRAAADHANGGYDDRPPGFFVAPQQSFGHANRASQMRPDANQGPNAALPQAQAAHRPARSLHHGSTVHRTGEHSDDGGSQHRLDRSNDYSQQTSVAASHSYQQHAPWQVVDRNHGPHAVPAVPHDSNNHYFNSYNTAVPSGPCSNHESPHYSDAGGAYEVRSERQPSSQDIAQMQSLLHHSAAGFEPPDDADFALRRRQAEVQYKKQQVALDEEQLRAEQKQVNERRLAKAQHSLYGSQSSDEQYHLAQQHPQHSIQYKYNPVPVQYPHQQVFHETAVNHHSYPSERHIEQPVYQQQHTDQTYLQPSQYDDGSSRQNVTAPAYQERYPTPDSYHLSDHSMSSASGHFAPLSSQHSRVVTQQHQPSRTEGSTMPQHAHQLVPYDHAPNQVPYAYPSGVGSGYSPSCHLQPAKGHYSSNTAHGVQQDNSQGAYASAWYGAGEQSQLSHGNSHHSRSQHHQPALHQPSDGHSDYAQSTSQLSNQYPSQQRMYSGQLSSQSHRRQQPDSGAAKYHQRYPTDQSELYTDTTSVQHYGQQPVAYSEQQLPDTYGTAGGHPGHQPWGAQQQPQSSQHTPQRDFSNQYGSQHHHVSNTEAPDRPQDFGQRQYVQGSAHLAAPERASAVNGYQSGMDSEGVRNGDVYEGDAYTPLSGGRRKLREVIGMMAWVMPKVTAADRLKTKGWTKPANPAEPWSNLQALTRREKRGYGWSTDEENSPSKAVYALNADKDKDILRWRSGRTSFLFRKADPPRRLDMACGWD